MALTEAFVDKILNVMDAVQNLYNGIKDGQPPHVVKSNAATAARSAGDAMRGEMMLMWNASKRKTWQNEVCQVLDGVSSKLHGGTPPADVIDELDQLINKASPLIWS